MNVRELWINDMPKLQTVKHNSFSNLKRLKMLHLDRNPNLTEIHENAFGVPETWPPIVEVIVDIFNKHNQCLSAFTALHQRQQFTRTPPEPAELVVFIDIEIRRERLAMRL